MPIFETSKAINSVYWFSVRNIERTFFVKNPVPEKEIADIVERSSGGLHAATKTFNAGNVNP